MYQLHFANERSFAKINRKPQTLGDLHARQFQISRYTRPPALPATDIKTNRHTPKIGIIAFKTVNLPFGKRLGPKGQSVVFSFAGLQPSIASCVKSFYKPTTMIRTFRYRISPDRHLPLAVLAMIFGLIGMSCAKAQSGTAPEVTSTARIEAEIADYNGGGYAFLIGTLNDQRFKMDSVLINPGGRITFTKDTTYAQGLAYILLQDNTSFPFLISEDQHFVLRTRKNAPVDAMVVEGSVDNQLFFDNLRFENDFQQRYQAISSQLKAQAAGDAGYAELKAQQEALLEARRQQLQAAFSQYPDHLYVKYKQAGQNPDLRDLRKPDGTVDQQAQLVQFRAEFWDNVDFSDPRLLRTPVIFNKLKRYITELTPQQPDSIIRVADILIDKVIDKPEYYQLFVNWIALQYEPTKTTLMDGEAVYVHMIQRYITKERAFWTSEAQISGLQQRAREMAASLVGKQAPNVTAKDPSGQLRSLYDLKAPYLVVFMYNPTCDHCIEETPKLVQFLRNRAEQDVEVFGIALDTEIPEWTAFLNTYAVPWVNVFDPTNRAIYAKYYVDITPEIYVLNPQRIIIGKNLKVQQIAEVIEFDKQRKQ